jgi:hypothetical protein
MDLPFEVPTFLDVVLVLAGSYSAVWILVILGIAVDRIRRFFR